MQIVEQNSFFLLISLSLKFERRTKEAFFFYWKVVIFFLGIFFWDIFIFIFNGILSPFWKSFFYLIVCPFLGREILFNYSPSISYTFTLFGFLQLPIETFLVLGQKPTSKFGRPTFLKTFTLILKFPVTRFLFKKTFQGFYTYVLISNLKCSLKKTPLKKILQDFLIYAILIFSLYILKFPQRRLPVLLLSCFYFCVPQKASLFSPTKCK
jgi:hypothetical protein